MRCFLNKYIFLFLIFSLFETSAYAFFKCEVTYDRTPCPGKEEISFAKCGGKQICTRVKRAESEYECAKAARNSCQNNRLDITKEKIITAKFNGVEIKSAEGERDFCLSYNKREREYNKCSPKKSTSNPSN